MSRAEKQLANLKAKEELNRLKAEVRDRNKDKNKDKEWYQHGWGLLAAILFFPYFLIWYAWAKSNWSQGAKIAVTSIVAVIMLPIMIGAANSEPSQESADTDTKQTQSTASETPPAETPQVAPAEVEPVKPVETPKVVETVSQKNAVKKAKSYISFAGFSRDGLVGQLEYDQFSNSDAIYGADNSGADWNEQAAKKAKSYMEFSSFSRGSLISQLEYDKFTPEQAAHGADSVGL